MSIKNITERHCPVCLSKEHFPRVVLVQKLGGAVFDEAFIPMTQQQFSLLKILHDSYPRAASQDTILTKLYPRGRPEWLDKPGRPSNHLRSQVFNINYNLREAKSVWEIAAQRGVGYTIRLRGKKKR